MERARSSTGVYIGITEDNGTTVLIMQLCWFILAGDLAQGRMLKRQSYGKYTFVDRSRMWHNTFFPKMTDRRHICTIQLNIYKTVTEHSQWTASLALEAVDEAALWLLRLFRSSMGEARRAVH